MRFSAVHTFASYLMIAAAFGALALSRELAPALVGVTALLAMASLVIDPARARIVRSSAWTISWTALTVAAFAWSALDAVRGEVLQAGVRFLCVLLVNKLWNRRASRDWLQAYVISLLMLVAGAALSSDLSFAACFLVYTVAATWTLILFHLRREMEENYLVKHAEGAQSERVEVDRILNSRRIVGGRFLGGTALVSLGIFLGATVLFFLIPRVGFGFFAQKGRKGQSVVGFSERVDIGEYGRIKDNPQVVMRVELPGHPSDENPGPLRLRGVSFDKYEHGHWTRSEGKVPSIALRRHGELTLVGRLAPAGRRIKGDELRETLARAREQQIYLEPLETPVLFAAPEPVAFSVPQALIARRNVLLVPRGPSEIAALEEQPDVLTGRVRTVERRAGIRYSAWSIDPPLDVARLASTPAGPPPTDAALQPYLQLPPDLPPRIAALAKDVTAPRPSVLGKAMALERYLQSTYRYSLDLGRDTRYEPIEDFLFVQKAGHCEYFASSMAVLLRTQGIPARVVNGFYGGEWNHYGRYVAIRQGDAHTWVEAWIDGAGWITFDPTPAGPAPEAGWLEPLKQVLDNLELAWFKWVIEYDLGKQVEAASALKRWATDANAGGSRLSQLLRARGLRVGAAVVVALGLAFWALRRRRRVAGGARPGRRRGGAALSAFDRAARALERRGFTRRPSETPRELASRVEAAGDPAAAPFGALVDLYYAARFGPDDAQPPAAELDRLSRAVLESAQATPPTIDRAAASR